MTRLPADRPAVPRARLGALLLALSSLGSACARPSVPARPLDEGPALARVRAARRPPAVEGGLTLAAAARLLEHQNPEVERALASAVAAEARARVRTPLPNPSVELGPTLLGPGLLESVRWGLDAALGFRVLLADTRSLTDDLRAVEAQAARAEVGAVTREEYLRLRQEYVAVLTLADVARARGELARETSEAVAAVERGLQAGESTRLDVSLLRLEAAETASERVEAEEAVVDARSAMGARLGVDALVPGREPSELPPLPSKVPAPERLEARALRDHPRLVRLRAAYLVAEKELRLEVARAWPSLELGVGVEKEEDWKLGLPLAIEIPLFDRNQVGIAGACARRDELRRRFEAELATVLAGIAEARARLEVRRRQLALRTAALAPAEETRRLAESVLRQAGAFDMPRYLEVLRATRRVEVEHLASRVAVYEAWGDLERACGVPLLLFATEEDR